MITLDSLCSQKPSGVKSLRCQILIPVITLDFLYSRRSRPVPSPSGVKFWLLWRVNSLESRLILFSREKSAFRALANKNHICCHTLECLRLKSGNVPIFAFMYCQPKNVQRVNIWSMIHIKGTGCRVVEQQSYHRSDIDNMSDSKHPSHNVLLFLAAHGEEHAQQIGLDLTPVKDLAGTVTIEGQKVAVTVGPKPATGQSYKPELSFVSTGKYDWYSSMYCHSVHMQSHVCVSIVQIPPVKEVAGTFYRRADRPVDQETTTFFIQQYPSFLGEPGQIVIDFWDDQRQEVIGIVSG